MVFSRRWAAVCFALTLLSCRPLQAGPSFTSFISFNAPGASNTFGGGINDSGAVDATYINLSGSATAGVVRFTNGSFSAPIVAPGGTVINTSALGINNAGTVVGYFLESVP